MNIAVCRKIEIKNQQLCQNLINEALLFFKANNYNFNFYEVKTKLKVIENADIITNGDLFFAEAPSKTDTYLLFYDRENLEGKLPRYQHCVNINGRGFIAFYINPKADFSVLLGVFVHEIIHALIIFINSTRPITTKIIDDIHNYSFYDARPEARYDVYLRKLMPYLKSNDNIPKQPNIPLKTQPKASSDVINISLDLVKHKRSREKISMLIPELQDIAINLIIAAKKSHNEDIQIYSTYRSLEEQNKLYAQGRSAPGKIITNAKGGDSWHNWKRAFDFCFSEGFKVNSKRWENIGKLGESLGLIWGTSFGDKPHFEYHPKLTLTQIKKEHGIS